MIIDVDFYTINNVWFTADTHFGHANIIKYCDRPFADVDEMDAALITNWNKWVKPTDTVWHLGDFTMGGVADAHKYFAQLNGNINILSNPWHHDKRWINDYPGMYTKNGEVDLHPSMVVLEVPSLARSNHNLSIHLCHYPIAEWDRKFHGGWHLHGHSHARYVGEGFIHDVGVDANNFFPINLGGILHHMYGRGFV